METPFYDKIAKQNDFERKLASMTLRAEAAERRLDAYNVSGAADADTMADHYLQAREQLAAVTAERDDLRLDRGKILLLNAEQALDNSKLRERVDALDKAWADAMIAHRWFSRRFGKELDGRDFSVKCDMADEHLAKIRRWEDGFRSIVTITWGARKEFEIPEIVEHVRGILADRDKIHTDSLDTMRAIMIALGCPDPLSDDAPDECPSEYAGKASDLIRKLREDLDRLAAALEESRERANRVRDALCLGQNPHDALAVWLTTDGSGKAAAILAERDQRVRLEFAIAEMEDLLGWVRRGEGSVRDHTRDVIARGIGNRIHELRTISEEPTSPANSQTLTDNDCDKQST